MSGGEFNFLKLIPEFILISGICFILFFETLHLRKKNLLNEIIGLFTLCYLFLFLLISFRNNLAPYKMLNVFISDGLTVFGKLLLTLSTLLSAFFSRKFNEAFGISKSKFFSLILLSLLGGFVIVSGTDLLTLYLGLELMTFPVYALIAMMNSDERTNEAAIKYIILSAFSTAFLLMGISFIYGVSGTTEISLLAKFFQTSEIPLYAYLGLILLLTGLAFKIALFPFHFWAPDVYEGSPSPVTLYMMIGMKGAMVFAFINVFFQLGEINKIHFSLVLLTIVLLTILYGNFVALVQGNFKRLLAYSSIAHSGYLILGIVSKGTSSISGMLFYLIVYILAITLPFGIIFILGKGEKYYEDLQDFKGLGKKYPFLGILMSLSMLTLAGLPPTPGFIAKFYIFKNLIDAGYFIAAFIGIFISLVSLYYYLKILVIMYMNSENDIIIENSWNNKLITYGLSFTSLVIVLLGILPETLINFIENLLVG